MAASTAIRVTHDVDADWSYVGSASTRGEGVTFDSGAERSSFLRYVLSAQVSRRVLLHFGAEWERFSFGVADNAPVPGTLQEISAVLGLDWQCSDRWLIRTEVQPGLYSDFQDLSWSDVDAPIRLGAAYLVNPDLQWLFGVRLDLASHYPVIPAAGVRWKFADEWTLNAFLPRVRLEYDLDSRFQAYLGGELKAGTFRLGDTFGDDRGSPDLNRGILDFLEVRVGPGFSWKARPNIILEANAGYMVYRWFDVGDREDIFRSDPAPYIQIACQLRF